MKKYTLLSLLTLSSSLFAADYGAIWGDVALPSGGDTATSTVKVNGAGTMTFASPSDVFTVNNINKAGTLRIMTITKDYNFDGIVKVTGTGGASDTWGEIVVSKGKTLTIKNLQSNITSNVRGFFKFFGETKTNNQAEYANMYIGTTQNDLYNSAGETEMWLNYVNFHAMSAPSKGYGYAHFQHGCNFICEANNILINTIAVRQSYATVTSRAEADANLASSFSGRLNLNGFDAKADTLVFNPSDNNADVTKRRCTDFYLDFGNSETALATAQTFYVGSIQEASTHNYIGNDRFFVENASLGDRIVFGEWIDENGADTNTKKLFETVLSVEDDVEYEVSKITEGQYAGKYAMTFIPEPSTYAMIFGAIALGFVAYRRRK